MFNRPLALHNSPPHRNYGKATPPPASTSAAQYQRLLDFSRATSSPHPHARNYHSNAGSLSHASISETQKASDWTILDVGGLLIRNLSRSLFQYTFLTHLYLNHNNIQYLPPAISMLGNLLVLDLSSNALSFLPPQVGLITTLKELLLFDNNISVLPPELGFLYQLEILGIDGNPFPDALVSLMIKEGTSGVITYLRENCPVGNAPPEREWIVLDEDEGSGASFTLLCYNILCEKYANQNSYGYTPSWVLNWEYRKELIIQEILNYNADIVCLQEMETGVYDDFFREQMEVLGEYEGVFYPKSRARTMDEYQRKGVDGCATFFKKSKFSLITNYVSEFQQIALAKPELRKTEDVFNRVMIKDNIATITFLESKDTKNKVRFVVGNAHLHWDPQYKDVKLVQTAMLMEELESFMKEQGGGGSYPLILCGDFNSLGDSGVYEYISTGKIAQSHPDFSSYTYGDYTTRGLSHPFNLKSAYSHTNALSFSNYTPGFKGVIDYVWYDCDGFGVKGLLGGVDDSYMERVVGFPNWHHPSDHIPLVVSLKFKRR